MYCNDDHSKLVPDSTRPSFFSPYVQMLITEQKTQKLRFNNRTKVILANLAKADEAADSVADDVKFLEPVH